MAIYKNHPEIPIPDVAYVNKATNNVYVCQKIAPGKWSGHRVIGRMTSPG